MKCPKCKEGKIITVRFRLSRERASLCNNCGALWFLGEKIIAKRAHNFRAFSKHFEHEHVPKIFKNRDHEHRLIYHNI